MLKFSRFLVMLTRTLIGLSVSQFFVEQRKLSSRFVSVSTALSPRLHTTGRRLGEAAASTNVYAGDKRSNQH